MRRRPARMLVLAVARALVLALALSAGACGRVGFGPASLEAGDAGGSLDAARPDAGGPGDAASPPDDGAPTTPDAGTSPVDAGPGAVDAGPGDDAGPCSESPCRLVAPQCGCTAGQMCQRATPGSTTRTCIAAGVTPSGGGCGFSNECLPGTTCVHAMSPSGQCLRWCLADADCATGVTCGLLVTGMDVGACESDCDPLAPTTTCPSGLGCRVLMSTTFPAGVVFHATICSAGTGAVEGAACATSLNCAPGLYCAPDGLCHTVCDPLHACGAGSCTPLSPPRAGLGYCA